MRRDVRDALTIVAFAALIAMLVAPLRGLTADEALYACAASAASPWRLADHPPALGLLLGATLRLHALPIELRVRAVSIALAATTSLALSALAARLAPPAHAPAARRCAAALASLGLMPMAGALICTPDAPMLASLAGLLLLMTTRKTAIALLAIGLLAGVAVASKVAALAVIGALAVGAGLRGDVLRASALGIGAALALPLARSSLELQALHALGRGPLASAPRIGSIAALGVFIVGQLALWSPWTLRAGWRGRAALERLAGGQLVVGTLFGLLATSALVSGRPPEQNWSAPAMLLVLVAAASSAAQHSAQRRTLLTAATLPTLIALALWALPIRQGPFGQLPTRRGEHQEQSFARQPAYAADARLCVSKLK